MNPSQTDTRPYLFDLWKEHHFDTLMLAVASGVSPQAVRLMLRYETVSRTEAGKVLFTLSQLLHQNYTLETVRVNVKE